MLALETAHAEIPCLVTEEYLHHLWEDRRIRYAPRDRVGQRLRDVLANNYQDGWRDVVQPGAEPVVANLIKAASRTITQRAGRYPRISAAPLRRRTSDLAIKRAEAHEIQLNIDLRKIGFRATLKQAVHWLVNHDMMVLWLRPSPYYGVPLIVAKDPLATYPGTVWPHKPEVYDVLFAEKMPAYQAVRMYPQIAYLLNEADRRESGREVVLGEFVDETGTVVALLEPMVKIVDWMPSPIPGQPSVFIGRGFSDDMDFHGQFDHSVPVLIAQAKLNGLMMTLAEMNVFAETNVFGEFAGNQTKYNWGPGAVNYIAASPGARVEKSINQMSPQVFQVSQLYERAIRMDAGFPGQLSGEPVATIATGKGIEELTTSVDDNTNDLQTIVQDTLIRVLLAYSEMAIAIESPDSDAYQRKGELVLTVQHLSSSDPAETIKFLQLKDAELMAPETIMDKLDDVPEAGLEQRLIDAAQLRSALKKGIEQRAAMPPEQGGMDPADIAKIISMRRQGIPIEEAVATVAKQHQAAAAAAPQPGAGGPPSIGDIAQRALGGKPLGLGEARTAERLMSQAPLAGTAALAAGQGQVQRQLGGGPAMAGAAVPPV